MTNGQRALINQAMDMIERQDMSHWTDAHDRVVVLALKEYRTVWGDEQRPPCGSNACPAGQCCNSPNCRAAGVREGDDAQR